MPQTNNNYGRDQNVINQTVYLNEVSLPRLDKANPSEYFINYLTTLFSLIGFLATWIVLGLFAKSEFPVGYVRELLVACIKGPKKFSQVLDDKQQEITRLSDIAFRARRNSKEESSRLHELDSKLDLLETTIGLLYNKVRRKEESVDRTLSKLKTRREEVHIDLDPLRQRYDPNLYKMTRISAIISEEALESERSFDYLENTLGQLSERYGVRKNLPSDDLVSKLIQDLRLAIVENSGNVRISRLKLLEHTLDMLQWSFSRRNDSSSPQVYSDKPVSQKDDAPYSKSKENSEQSLPETNDVYSSLHVEFFDPEKEKKNSFDLREVIEKPDGEFVNKSWLKAVNSTVSRLLRELGNAPSEWVDKVIVGINNEWINQVSVYGFNYETEAEVELTLTIDWDNQEVISSRESLNQEADMNKVISAFQEFITRKALSSEWRVRSTQEPMHLGLRELGFIAALPVTWATSGTLSKALVSGLSKLFVELNFGPSE